MAMNPVDMLDYALGRLEGPRRDLIEQRLNREPALARRVARLIQNLNRLLDDGQGRFRSEESSLTPSTLSSPDGQGSVTGGQSSDPGEKPDSNSPRPNDRASESGSISPA